MNDKNTRFLAVFNQAGDRRGLIQMLGSFLIAFSVTKGIIGRSKKGMVREI